MKAKMPRMPWWLISGICALLVLALAAAVTWSSSEAQAAADVTVVYFYPRDAEPNTEYIAQIDGIMADVQGWYGGQVGSTFPLGSVQTVQGADTAAGYGNNIWGGVLIELGYYCGTGVHVVFLHPSLPFMGGGSCDAVYTSDGRGGTAMISEGASTGGVAHELGHAFALPHPGECGIVNPWPDYCSYTVMWSHWYYPDVGLLDLVMAPEKQTLAGSPFFSLPAGGTGGTTPGTVDGPDTTAPTVRIASPNDGTLLRGRWLNVRAEGADNLGVAKMELYIDSQLVLTTKSASVDLKWDTRGISKGSSFRITVTAFDEAGNSGAAAVGVSK